MGENIMLFASPGIDVTGSKAIRIELFSAGTPQMRAFHVTWLAFFVCFFAWFAAAPLMPLIKTEFGLSKDQIANINIAAVAVTILVRLVVGPLCDRFGPRRTYTWLLLLGAIPVFGLAFAQTYETFLFFRLAIGAIGASFVITQYHTSVMFAPNVVGTANATVGGWGNAGGGAAQSLMPLVVAAMVGLGVEHAWGWRAAMFVPGVAMVAMAFVYARYTQDTPQGDIVDLRAAGIELDGGKATGMEIFRRAAANYRTWMLAATYGACFGVEIFIHNIAASYYVDRFGLSLTSAGLAAGIFGGLALFARALAAAVRADARRGCRAGLVRQCRQRHARHPRDDDVRAVHAHGVRRNLCAGAVRRPQGIGRGRRADWCGRQYRRGRGWVPQQGIGDAAAMPDCARLHRRGHSGLCTRSPLLCRSQIG
jgi:NNP family nitrate/nitrite transporter-like MFS transporter